jgi:hypothetical protein
MCICWDERTTDSPAATVGFNQPDRCDIGYRYSTSLRRRWTTFTPLHTDWRAPEILGKRAVNGSGFWNGELMDLDLVWMCQSIASANT